MLRPPIARIKDPEAHHAGTHLSAAWNCFWVLSVSKSTRLPGKRIDFETESLKHALSTNLQRHRSCHRCSGHRSPESRIQKPTTRAHSCQQRGTAFRCSRSQNRCVCPASASILRPRASNMPCQQISKDTGRATDARATDRPNQGSRSPPRGHTVVSSVELLLGALGLKIDALAGQTHRF